MIISQAPRERKGENMARLPAGMRAGKKPGSIEYRFYVDGKRYSVVGKSAKECNEKRRELEAKLSAGSYQENESVTLNSYFDEWIQRRRGEIKENSLYHYSKNYDRHIRATDLGGCKVTKIERRQLIAFRNDLAERTSVYVAKDTLKLLHAVLKAATIDGIINANPAESIPHLKPDTDKKPARETVHRALTEWELSVFFKYAPESTAYADIFKLQLLTGMRAGEACGLKWSDIDTEAGKIHIQRTVSRDRNGKATLTTPKTAKSKRDIPINKQIAEFLSELRDFQKATKGNITGFENLVFTQDQAGKCIYPGYLNKGIQATLYKAEREGYHIEPFGSHAFRDTFATLAIKGGMKPNTLKEILGHSSLAMTMDLYAHVMDDTKAEEMELVNIEIKPDEVKKNRENSKTAPRVLKVV